MNILTSCIKKNRMKEVKEKRKISYDTYIIIHAKLDYTK